VKKLSLVLFLSWQLLHADTPGIRVVNGASFMQDASLAPGAIISIFGPSLANTTALAPDFSNLPTTLGNITVSIGSTQLPLFFVTATQINAWIPASIAPGHYTLTIQSPTGRLTKDIVLAANSSPGIFSLFGTGTRDGAIQNGVTYQLGPFTPTTNGAPTFLTIYTTGLDLSTPPTVTIGGVTVPVTFYGATPCCPALQQVNVKLTQGVAGAGRVELAINSGGKISNIVEVVILPNPGQGPFPPSGENQARSREVSNIAYIPLTSLALVTDENDDLVRVIDVQKRQVTRTMTLPEGAQPVAIAVNGSGTLAVVAERDRGKVAILNLIDYVVSAEVVVGSGPTDVSIAANTAVVANQDSDTASIIDLTTNHVTTVNVGRGPRGVAADSTLAKAYVTNQDDGTISVINLNNLQAAPALIRLPGSARPALIGLIPSLKLAVVTVPSASASAEVLTVNLDNGSAGTLAVNGARNGGATGLAVNVTTVYFADQTGGSVTIAPMGVKSGSAPITVSVDLGARAVAVDPTDNLLLVANEGTGTIVLMDLSKNQVTGRINAVRSEHEAESGDHNNHNDRTTAANAPAITSIDPINAAAGTTFTLTVHGTNLQGADNIFFVDPATLPGHGNGHDQMENDERAHSPFGIPDTNFTVSNIQTDSAGILLTATVTIAKGAARGQQRVVRVEAPNGDTSWTASSANTFLIN
jgi:uncharacterized protein (TIGR03437 family)